MLTQYPGDGVCNMRKSCMRNAGTSMRNDAAEWLTLSLTPALILVTVQTCFATRDLGWRSLSALLTLSLILILVHIKFCILHSVFHISAYYQHPWWGHVAQFFANCFMSVSYCVLVYWLWFCSACMNTIGWLALVADWLVNWEECILRKIDCCYTKLTG